MTVETDVGATFLEARSLNGANPKVERPPIFLERCNHIAEVGPLLSAVARDPQGAVVGTGPKDVRALGGFRYGRGAAALCQGDFRRHDLEIVSAIERFEDELAS